MSTFTDDTSERFSLIELDSAPTKNVSKERQAMPVIPAPAAQPASATAPRAQAPAPATEVSNPVRALATKEAELARELGFDVKNVDDGLLFDAGTELYDIGQDNLKRYAEEYKALPTLRAVAADHAKTIAAEDRKTSVTNLAGWRLDACGQLRAVTVGAAGAVTFGKPAIDLSENAVTQLRSYYPHGKARDLAERGQCIDANGKIVAYPADKPLPASPNNVNAWIGDLKSQNRLRARTHRGRREIFSVHSVSKRGYVEFDTDKLLAEAAKIAGDLRCELTYDADSTRVRARCIAQAPIDVPAFNGVGRVHRIGFDLCSADDGSMSLQVGSFLIRVRCKNASLVTNQGKRSRFRHVGTFAKLRDAMANALTEAGNAVEQMRALWAQAAVEHFCDEETGVQLSATESIERLVRGEYLPTGGLSPEDAIDAYTAAWRAEDSPHSSMGVLMAVQRAAHESSWRTSWAQDEIEEAASQLLYQPVLQLATFAEEAPSIEV